MMFIFSLLVANVADMAVNKRWASINFVRKASNTIGKLSSQSTNVSTCSMQFNLNH